MARMIKVKLIMELRDQGMARRSIAKTRHMSMGSVFQVFDIADDRGITWIQVKDLGEEQVYSLFHPERNVRESVFEELDWSYVHTEMAKVGVNLRLLHDEYKVQCAREHKTAMGYTRFCGPQGRPQGRRVDAVNLPLRRRIGTVLSCGLLFLNPLLIICDGLVIGFSSPRSSKGISMAP